MKKILFTNFIEEKYADELEAYQVEQVPFIMVQKVSIDYELDIDVEYPVIVTSKNAIWAVDELKLVNNPLYVAGTVTGALLESKGYNVEAIGYDAFDLTSKLPFVDAYFLCGTRKRDTIPNFYKDKDYDLTEIEVYETELIPQKIESDFDAIVFMSPSAVDSYFELNTIPEKTKIFAIGNTTSLQISHHTSQEVIEADKASVSDLVQTIKEVM